MKRRMLLVLVTLGVALPRISWAQAERAAPPALDDAIVAGLSALRSPVGGRRGLEIPDEAILPEHVSLSAAQKLKYAPVSRTVPNDSVETVFQIRNWTRNQNEVTLSVMIVSKRGKRWSRQLQSISVARRGASWVVTGRRRRGLS
jgi:hypothetical protein